MVASYLWGVMGPGKIAHKFAQALEVTQKGRLYAVASRDKLRAKTFGEEYGATKFYDEYQSLLDDDKIDIVYIATPHHLHYQLTKDCLKAGKHVLCEKPVTMTASQFDELRKLAKEKKLFYMDALWTRFLPSIEKCLELKDSIGPIKMLNADFGFKADYNKNSRLFNPMLGGGSLMDIGIYPVFLSLLLMGVPEKIMATAILGKTGVDESMACIFKYSNGALASLNSSFLANTKNEACISGENGQIILHPGFHMSTHIELKMQDEKSRSFHFEFRKNGYEYEAEEVMNCLDKGLIQSPKLPHEFTMNLMKTLDEIRSLCSINYPFLLETAN